jgi:hypothetical protein
MNDNLIINYSKEENRGYFATNAYTFKWNWLKFILSKLKIIKVYDEMRITFEKKRIDRNSIKDQIYKILNELRIDAKEVNFIIIGRKQAMMLDDEFYSIEYHEQLTYFDNGIRRICNVEIQINPYIDGIVPFLKGSTNVGGCYEK